MIVVFVHSFIVCTWSKISYNHLNRTGAAVNLEESTAEFVLKRVVFPVELLEAHKVVSVDYN